MSTHPKLTRIGDALDVASLWIVAVCFWVCAVFAAVVLGTLGLLFVLNLIGVHHG